MNAVDLELAMETARRAVEAAAKVALTYFRRDVPVETKPDHTPVTVADRESEAAVIAVIRAAFPAHGFLGEETGAQGSAASRWIVDPIDGTRGFIRGRSFWGPVLGLEHDGEMVAGAMALPALGETYWGARGLGAWMRTGRTTPVRLQVSQIADWREATFSMGEPQALLAPSLREPVTALVGSSATTRCYGDLAGFALVLGGKAEAWIEAGVQLWDIAGLQVLIEEAGGRFTDLAGRPTPASGACIASNGRVHDHLLRVLGGGPA